MYQVYNNEEGAIIFDGNESDFIDFVKKIVIEDGNNDYSVLGASDAVEYIEDYCDNLILL